MTTKLERLLNLTALLLDTERPVGIEQIGRVIEGYPPDPASFRRTFERDKDDLREMGIAVEVINTDVHDKTALGYRILPERYYLADPGLEPDEMAALKLAMGAIRLDGIATQETLRKLGDASGDSAQPELASVPTPPVIGDLHAAINEHRLVQFAYNGEQRTVEPQRLEFHKGRWYLRGFDRLREDRRSFRIDRVEGSITAGEPGSFEPSGHDAGPAGFRFDPWRHGDDAPVTAVLRIDATQAAFSRSLVQEEAVWTDLDDGSVTLEVEVTNRRAFRTFVLGLLEHAEIVSPPELRDDLVEWLEATIASRGAV